VARGPPSSTATPPGRWSSRACRSRFRPASPDERGRDGWADYDQDTGFERELRDLLWSTRRVRNQIWITTDVHFGAVFRYTPFDRAPSFHLYEIASGPLNAGVFPKREFDRSLGTESLFFHGPETAEDIADFAEAKHWFNFGELEVDTKGGLTARLVTALGEIVWEQKLSPR